jgi:hypothetical protein
MGREWGYVNATGETVIPPRFRVAGKFHDGRAPVTNGMYWGYIDRAGEIAIEPQFVVVGRFADGVAPVVVDRKYVLVSRSGERVGTASYPFIGEFSEGLASVCTGSLWGYLDNTCEMVIDARFDVAFDFHEGRAAVRVDEGWGYIDRYGETVIEPRFDEAESFSAGRALVRRGGEWAYVDRNGSTLQRLRPADVPPRWWWDSIPSGAGEPYETREEAGSPEQVSSALSEGDLGAIRLGRRLGYLNSAGTYVWKPTLVPDRELETPTGEEYAVYSVLVADSIYGTAHVMARTKLYGNELDPFLMFEPRIPLEEASSRLEGVRQSTLDDLVLKRDCSLENRFERITRRVVMVDFLSGWTSVCLQRQSPEADVPELMVFSRVGFNEEGTQALVYVSATRAPRDGTGEYVLLEKADGVWKIRQRHLAWIS